MMPLNNVHTMSLQLHVTIVYAAARGVAALVELMLTEKLAVMVSQGEYVGLGQQHLSSAQDGSRKAAAPGMSTP